jgi:hypothetical protein
MGTKPLTDWFRLMGNYGFSQLKREALVETALIGGWIRNYTNGVGWIDGTISSSPRVEAAYTRRFGGVSLPLIQRVTVLFRHANVAQIIKRRRMQARHRQSHCHLRQPRGSETSAAPELSSSLACQQVICRASL